MLSECSLHSYLIWAGTFMLARSRNSSKLGRARKRFIRVVDNLLFVPGGHRQRCFPAFLQSSFKIILLHFRVLQSYQINCYHRTLRYPGNILLNICYPNAVNCNASAITNSIRCGVARTVAMLVLHA